MAVEVFKGKLDAPKVEVFTGKLDGPSMSADITGGASMGPPSQDWTPQQATQQMYRQVHEQTQAGNDAWINQPDSGPKSAPFLLGAAASMAVPGSGFLPLLAQSAAAGGGTFGGELWKQNLTREPANVTGAAKEGAMAAGGNLAGGLVVQGLGALAKKLFSPLGDTAQAGAQFARENDAPFPLASAAPGSGAGMTQQASRAFLPGELKTQADSNRVAQFINSKVGTIVESAKPVDDAATAGQQYLRQVFAPGETIYTDTFKGLRSTLGDETPIPLTNTIEAMQGVSESLKDRGEMKGVYNRIRNILKAAPTEQTVSQVDELYSGLLKDASRNPNARREVNVVLNALSEDIDGVAKGFGVSFTDQIATAKAARDQLRNLRDIPQLERLSKDFGDKGATLGTRQWMSEMFANPNGKALAEIRDQNPQLYHDLADSWVASNISRFSRRTDSSIGSVLDGNGLRTWFEQNQSNLKTILGAPQTQALDNFTAYASSMTGAVSRANRGGLDATGLMLRGGAEAAGLYTRPHIVIPGEAASFVLARGLSDPNSSLFRLFTEGVKPATKSFWRMSGSIGGQAAADAFNPQ